MTPRSPSEINLFTHLVYELISHETVVCVLKGQGMSVSFSFKWKLLVKKSRRIQGWCHAQQRQTGLENCVATPFFLLRRIVRSILIGILQVRVHRWIYMEWFYFGACWSLLTKLLNDALKRELKQALGTLWNCFWAGEIRGSPEPLFRGSKRCSVVLTCSQGYWVFSPDLNKSD